MPTPNWGPKSGVPMDQATFDAYVASNPPGAGVNGVFGNSQVGQNNAAAAPYADPSGYLGNQPGGGTTGGYLDNPGTAGGPLRPQRNSSAMPPAGGVPNQNTDFWSQFFMNGPSSVNMPGFQAGNSDQDRVQQQRVIQDLQRSAAGDRNSLAQQQLRSGTQAAQQQQASIGSTMRGTGRGAAMRAIGAGQAGIQAGLAGNQKVLMAQEQQASQAMLAQMLAQQHGQDINQATGMANGINQGNALQDAMRQFYAQMGSTLNQEQGQIGNERNAAQLGFDLDNKETTNRLLRQGAGALAGGLGTWSSMGGDSQTKIDNAFNGKP